MKTLFFKILPTCIGVLLIILVATQAANAQKIISVEFSSEQSLLMEITDENVSERPNKLILIFDSTEITYEFDDSEDIAMSTVRLYNGCSGSSHVNTSVEKVEVTRSKSISSIEDIFDEPVDLEPELDTEDWMLKPSEWLTKN